MRTRISHSGSDATNSAELAAKGGERPIAWAIRCTWLPFLVSRGAVFLVAALLAALLDSGALHRYDYLSTDPLSPLTGMFDANWYVNIAAHGYSAPQPGAQPSYAFYPLYPFLMRVVGDLTSLGRVTGGYALVGVLLSHVLFFAAVCVLCLLVVRAGADERTAAAVAWVVCLLPSAFVFSMAYTESLFLLMTLLAVWFVLPSATRADGVGLREVALSGLAAGLATLTRPQGILVLVCTLWLVAVNYNRPRAATPLLRRYLPILGRWVLAAGPSVAALVGFALYIASVTGSYTSLAESRRGWGQGWWADMPRLLQLPPGNPAWWMDVLQLAALVAWVVASVAIVWVALRGSGGRGSEQGRGAGEPIPGQGAPWYVMPPFVAYAVISLLAALSSAPANSSWGRYMAPVFPLLGLLAAVAPKLTSKRLTVVAALLLQTSLLTAAVVLQVTP
jgi:Mannosyltransferase (PIG-V)